MRSVPGVKGLFLAALMIFTAFVAGCNGSGSNSGSSSTTIVVGSSNATLSIANTSLPLSGNTTVTATFKNSDGTPATGVTVTFTTTQGTLQIGSGAPASSVSTTTDSTGTAQASLTAGSVSGQGQVTASATIEGHLVTTTGLFSINLPVLTLKTLSFTNNSSATINYGSTQGISVQVTDSTGALYTAQPVDVVFTSAFASQGKATIGSPVTAVNGVATTTYTALTGTGADTITASISGSSLTKTLTVKALDAGAISFVSASPTTIGLKGMGGAGIQETSKVVFKVVDTSGAAKANQPVTFSLNTNLGGISLTSSSGSTAADGTVSTIVQSGLIATPVRVTATTTVNGRTLQTQSDQLVISTGVPAQDGLSVALGNLNPEAWSIDGQTVSVTARLSDHFHNPVPDGTAVSFTTSGGSIQPSCQTVNGACSVTWTSQNPRPLKDSPTTGEGALRNGRAVILAYAIGEEAFIDINGNGVADPGEFTDTSEAFRDDNENGTRDPWETYIDFNGDSQFNSGDGYYNGVLQGQAAINAGAPKSKNVFLNVVLVMSTSSANITFQDAGGITAITSVNAPGQFTVTVRDLNGNTMPSGTKIAVTAPFGTLSGVTSYTVPQNTGSGVSLPVFIAASSSPTAKSGVITVTATSPAGLVTTTLLPISGSF